MSPRRNVALLFVAVMLVGYLIGGGGQLSVGLLTDSENISSTFTTAASFGDTIAPVVASSVISKTVPYAPGYVRQGGAYYVYANVSDAGGSGLSTVTADLSTVTTGQAAAALVAGAYSAGGVSYSYRSASITANALLVEGATAYTVTATDGAGNAVTQGGFSVIVDNTPPSGSDVQTTNVGTAGSPELGDSVTLVFSEPIDPESVLAGWTGASTSVVVRITDNAGGDQLTVRNAANTAALPLGTVNLVGTAYVTVTRDFGATGAASTMVLSGNTITVTLGTPSGAVGTQAVAVSMIWTPSATPTDRAGNSCLVIAAAEAAPPDIDF